MRLQKPLNLSQITQLVPEENRNTSFFSRLTGLDLIISSLDSPYFSTENSLTFIRSNAPASLYRGLNAACAISESELADVHYPFVRTDSIYEIMCIILNALKNSFVRSSGRGCLGYKHDSAVVKGVVEKDAVVGPGCYVGTGSVIGSGTVLSPNVTVLNNCRIGKDCELQSGVVVGSPGFGYYEYEGKTKPIPHFAGVEIDDRVRLGANSVVAAGVLNPTCIGENCKLDSHIQIAHNVHLGKNSLIASQSGIAGSTIIGEGLRMGGASSIDGHLRIGKDVSIAARTGVTKNISDGAVVAGYPAQPLKSWKKQKIFLRNRVK